MNIWEQRAACQPTHARKTEMGWVPGENDTYHLVIQGNGNPQIRIQCGACGAKIGFLPHETWREWQQAGAVLSGGKVCNPTTYEPCSYKGCDATVTEMHHFAPYNTFGADSSNWPCLPLCREHHHGWHRTMTGYSWHAKRSA